MKSGEYRKHHPPIRHRTGRQQPCAGRSTEADEFVQGVFAAAKLPLLRVPVKVGYAPSEIEALLRPHLVIAPIISGRAELPLRPEVEAAPQRGPIDTGRQLCPKCGAEMKLRIAKSGANVGGQFWGCGNFPKCRFVLPVTSVPTV